MSGLSLDSRVYVAGHQGLVGRRSPGTESKHELNE